MSPRSPAGIAARIRWLIEKKDKGRLDVAARRLGVRQSELEQLERLLSGDAGPRGTQLLAAVVDGYHEDACWLLTGREEVDSAALPGEARLEVAHLLLEIASTLLAERARQRSAAAAPKPA
jgi:hypothetical protein